MSQGWQRCPHCDVYSMPVPGGAQAVNCRGCGRPVRATAEKIAEAGWYYSRNNQPVGPLSLARMKELAAKGNLLPTDLVLQAGAQQWIAAGDMKELFPASIVPPTAFTESVLLTCGPDKSEFDSRHQALWEAQIVPEAANCVQCGMCTFNCPMEIDVRAHAWRGKSVRDSHCLTCSECVHRCPRGVLRLERIPLFIVK